MDVLQVDQSFVSRIDPEAGEDAVTGAIIQLAHAYGLEIVAEGIECEAQLAYLRERRVQVGQGFYFARPMPEAALLEWCRERSTGVPASRPDR